MSPIDEVTLGVARAKTATPTTGLYPAAPAPDHNPGQVAGSGMAGAGNALNSGISLPSNEGCIDPGARTFAHPDNLTPGPQHRLNMR